MSVYKFVFDTGEIHYVRARTRQSAISKLALNHIMSIDWIIQHSRIVRMGIEVG